MADARFSEQRIDPSTLVLEVHGEVDMASAPALRRRVDAALGDGTSALVVDLCAADHLDSSGLSELIGAHQRLGAGGGRLALVVASGAMRRTFEVRGLDRLLRLFGDRDEALAWARGG